MSATTTVPGSSFSILSMKSRTVTWAVPVQPDPAFSAIAPSRTVIPSGPGVPYCSRSWAGVRPWGTRRRVPEGLSPVQLLEKYGTPGPDGITILLGAVAQKAGSG